MKNHTIKTPIAELLIVELAEGLSQMRKNTLSVMQHDGWKLLGKLGEIKEEDTEKLVEKVMNSQHFQNYKGRKEKDFANLWCKTAKESLLSLIESEIYWENPIKVHTWASENADIYYKRWHEAEQKTFDRNRTLIFKKNK